MSEVRRTLLRERGTAYRQGIMTYDGNTTYPARCCADCPFIFGAVGETREATSADDLSLPLYEASFEEAIKRFFKKYTTFSGRASRSEYWWVVLFYLGLNWIPLIFLLVGSSYASSPTASESGTALAVVGGILMFIAYFGTIVPLLAISWRRLHDGGFAGPLYLLIFVPGVGGMMVFILMLMPPEPKGQRFDA